MEGNEDLPRTIKLQVRFVVFQLGSMAPVSYLGLTPEVTALHPDSAFCNAGLFCSAAGQSTSEEKKTKETIYCC